MEPKKNIFIADSPTFEGKTWMQHIDMENARKVMRNFEHELMKYLKNNLNAYGYNFDVENPQCPKFMEFAPNITRIEYTHSHKVEYFAQINGEKKMIGVTNEGKKEYHYNPKTNIATWTIG